MLNSRVVYADTFGRLPRFPRSYTAPPTLRRPLGGERSSLFNLRQLEVQLDEADRTLWTFMKPEGRPAFNPAMLKDYQRWQDEIARTYDASQTPIRYLVLGSRFPGIFCLGGDLDLFARCIRAGDRDALVRYGNACVGILYRNMIGLDRPIVTIGLVQGDALGGGFEALLSFNVVVAERGARFGLPETTFGLFPGMGAHCFLSRRLGSAQAERMILGGKMHSAEEMYDLGIVHVLAEPGQGEAAVKDYIRQHGRRHGGHLGVYRATRTVNPITLEELEEIVEVWADSALELQSRDLRLMERLVLAQSKLRERAG
ncbi:MAG TPA: crotonase/enoyl-CoA hydratase family protein [Caulobacteraceae bacterium]|nr:crotonase/enoyl-CoA hydratase family protein [Caulobacteraceae bacterium]